MRLLFNMKQDAQMLKSANYFVIRKLGMSVEARKTSRQIRLLVCDVTSPKGFNKMLEVFMECHPFKPERHNSTSSVKIRKMRNHV